MIRIIIKTILKKIYKKNCQLLYDKMYKCENIVFNFLNKILQRRKDKNIIFQLVLLILIMKFNMMMKWGMHIRILILCSMFHLIIIQKVLIFEL